MLMLDIAETLEHTTRPRKPSLPALVYEVAHQLRLNNATEGDMILFRELCERINRNEIPYRPSVLEEFTRRALHGIGCSGMSNEDMLMFIKECRDEL